VAPAEIDRQRAANRELARTAAETEALAVDWEQLQREAAALQARQAEINRQARETAAQTRAALAGETRTMSELDVPPKAARLVAPAYPYALRDQQVGGSVVVEMVIGADGKIVDAKIVKSSRPEFEVPSLDAVKKWQFTAGRANGRAVNTRVTQELKFEPTGQAPTPPAPDWF
jgi:TonB family protein